MQLWQAELTEKLRPGQRKIRIHRYVVMAADSLQAERRARTFYGWSQETNIEAADVRPWGDDVVRLALKKIKRELESPEFRKVFAAIEITHPEPGPGSPASQETTS